MDILVAVALFVLTSAMAYLGVRVTLHPAKTTEQKRKYKLTFSALTVLATALIAWQGYTNRKDQGKLQSQLSDIEHNTERVEHTHIMFYPPEATNGFPVALPFHSNETVKISIPWVNVGDYAVLKSSWGVKLLVVPAEQWVDTYAAIKTSLVLNITGAQLPARSVGGSYYTFTVQLSDKEARMLNTGRSGLCVIGLMRWNDNSGTYQTRNNQCLMGANGIFNWHNMAEDNQEQKL